MRTTLLAKSKNTVTVFISYSHQDMEFRENLESHLSLLKRDGVISVWHDHMIQPGDDWEMEISEHLLYADVILMLISPHFVQSDYCWEKEMSVALKRHDEGNAIVIPIIVRPLADWESSPLGTLQALPSGAKPVSKWRPQDDAYVSIAKGIKRVLDSPVSRRGLDRFVRWKIKLDVTCPQKSVDRYVVLLRKILNQPRIEIIDSGSGSLYLELTSPQSAYKLAKEYYAEDSLSEKLGVSVIEISEPLGALVRICAYKSSSGVQTQPIVRSIAKDEPFEPILSSMVIDPANPIQPGFSIGCHPQRTLNEREVMDLTLELGRFLNIFLIVTNDNLHANLSPYEEDCGLPKPLRNTELGLILLQQDLQLKIETSLLLHPETSSGSTFWSNIPDDSKVDSVMRVWIVPGSCSLKQSMESGKAIITLERMELKVLCEGEYQEGGESVADSKIETVFRESILSELWKRVNLSFEFSKLRQLFTILIMSQWIRKEMPQIVEVFGNTNRPNRYETAGIDEKIIAVKKEYLRHIAEGAWSYRVNTKGQRQQRILTVGGIRLDKISHTLSVSN